ncbi:MAG: response regulator [Phycisphaerae bacterium]|nr:response regulator [Phycisphaerae bacterium]
MSRVLIVDDEMTYCEQLTLILVRESHEVRSASSVEKGIQVGLEFRPNLLVADWRLADGRNGIEVARALASAIPDLLTILITGCLVEEIPLETRQSVFRVLEKPFSLDEVVTAIHDAATSPV